MALGLMLGSVHSTGDILAGYYISQSHLQNKTLRYWNSESHYFQYPLRINGTFFKQIVVVHVAAVPQLNLYYTY